jgi:hypothetical protein
VLRVQVVSFRFHGDAQAEAWNTSLVEVAGKPDYFGPSQYDSMDCGGTNMAVALASSVA